MLNKDDGSSLFSIQQSSRIIRQTLIQENRIGSIGMSFDQIYIFDFLIEKNHGKSKK